MGLLDFFKKGTEKPAPKPAAGVNPQTNKANVPHSATASTPASATNVAKPAAAPELQLYTVQKGDSLSKIAKNFYGDANKWNKIFDANKDILKNPDLIQPGQKLKIPTL